MTNTDTARIASLSRAGLDRIRIARRVIAKGDALSAGLRTAIVTTAGLEAEAARPFDAYARTYAEQYVGTLLAEGNLDAIEERFARHFASLTR